MSLSHQNKSVERYRRYCPDKIGHVDKTTDGQTDRVIPIYTYPLPIPPGKFLGGVGMVGRKTHRLVLLYNTLYKEFYTPDFLHTSLYPPTPSITSMGGGGEGVCWNHSIHPSVLLITFLQIQLCIHAYPKIAFSGTKTIKIRNTA